MPRSPRRSTPARPQTTRCRYVDPTGQRCRSIATVAGFCVPHERALEQDLAKPSPLEQVVNGLFGVRPMSPERMAAAGAAFVNEQLRQRFPQMMGQPGVPAGARPAPPGPRPRPSPEAIAARKADLAARGLLGFEPDQALTEQAVKERRRDLARLYHDDGRSKDTTRQAMMQRVNEAADLLLAAARATARPRP